jgi:hypothetical protein
MFSRESVHVAVGVLIALVVLHLVRNFFRPAAPTRHASGAPYIPGQAMA